MRVLNKYNWVESDESFFLFLILPLYYKGSAFFEFLGMTFRFIVDNRRVF